MRIEFEQRSPIKRRPDWELNHFQVEALRSENERLRAAVAAMEQAQKEEMLNMETKHKSELRDMKRKAASRIKDLLHQVSLK